jgi:hypothetical protein
MQKTSGLRRTRHLSWELFQRRISQGPPSLEPIAGRPKAVVFIAPHGSRLGLRVMGAVDSLPPSPLAEVGVRAIGVGKGACVEVTTANSDLYREFYSFCCDVADRIQLDGEDVVAALTSTLQRWASLLRRKSLLSEEKQVGLFGELWFLARIAGRRGWRFAAGAWRGPEAEEHDFTLITTDVEVKTTRAERRLHTISSLTQLLPKARRPLVLLSLQLTRGGGGAAATTLPQAIARVLTGAAADGPGTASVIRNQIERYGWTDEDAGLYPLAWELRTYPALIAVDQAFPAIIPRTLRSLGADRLSRIGRVTYEVNLDGLGAPCGAKALSTLLKR